MKLKSFGCSFTFGNELPDSDWNHPSQMTWPALLAKDLGLEYECYARPGSGNLQIMSTVFDQSYLKEPAVFVINWTWIDRFDYMDPLDETFRTLCPGDDRPEHKLYYKYFFNQYHAVLNNAAYIVSALHRLQAQGNRFIMTAQDRNLIEPIDPDWHDPRSVTAMQNFLKPNLTWFEDLSFLDWSKQNKFAISELLHPGHEAHQAAFELIKSYNLLG